MSESLALFLFALGLSLPNVFGFMNGRKSLSLGPSNPVITPEPGGGCELGRGDCPGMLSKGIGTAPI